VFALFENAVGDVFQRLFDEADVANVTPMEAVRIVEKMIVASSLQSAEHRVDAGDFLDVGVKGGFFGFVFHGVSPLLYISIHASFVKVIKLVRGLDYCEEKHPLII
jgi:hypothetical protein